MNKHKEIIKAKFGYRTWGANIPAKERDVDDYINPSDWWGETYAIGISCGFMGAVVVVEAGNEGDALDALIDDGSWNHLFVYDEEEDPEKYLNAMTEGSVGGNDCLPYDHELIMFVSKCEVTEYYSIYPKRGKYEWL